MRYRGFEYTCFRDTDNSTPRACVIAKGILPDLSTGDLVVAETNLRDIGRLILSFAYFSGYQTGEDSLARSWGYSGYAETSRWKLFYI